LNEELILSAFDVGIKIMRQPDGKAYVSFEETYS
jgi:hypothetical protein